MQNAYQTLEKRFYRLSQLDHLASVAYWDQATMMPSGGAQARGKALAELAVLQHELLTQADYADLFQGAAQVELDPWQAANLVEMQRSWKQATAVPAALVEAKSLAASECEHAWRTLREENNWNDFQPLLNKVIGLIREEADARMAADGVSGDKAKRYDRLLARFEPGMSTVELDPIFAHLKAELPQLIAAIKEHQQHETVQPFHGNFPVAAQQALAREVIGRLGFNFDHGRLDVSAHPFCGGVAQDVRITSRYNENDFTEGLFGVIHETGHASYERGRPAAWLEQPVSTARSMGIHESQSLLFEMQVALSRPFIQFLQPLVEQHFGPHPSLSADNLYKRVTRVKPGLIRVNADEATYPMHVVLRYELEQALLQEQIETADIPDLWQEKMEAYLGLSTAGNYKDGCMQDIHWTFGEFGYFPTYSLGAMNAAQLYAALSREVSGVEAHIASGNFKPLTEWLGDKIWQQGSVMSTRDLMRHATGEPLNPDYFLAHLRQRYLNT